MTGIAHLRGPAPGPFGPEPGPWDLREPRPPATPPPPPRDTDRLLHPLAARAIVFVALTAFGALHWMRMLEPAATARAWYALGAGLLTMLALLGAARLRRRALRAAACLAAVVAGLALAILGAGAADEMLTPSRWGDLSAIIGRGLDGLAGARVPYRGLDDALRLVIPLGGTALAVVAAALAFWPRRGGRTGWKFCALVALVTLYAVPAVALIYDAEFLRGALLALLVLGFLRLERLRRRDAAAAGFVAGGAAALAMAIAPALDGIEPWWDYENWALSQAGSKTTTFNWDHDYGPLKWPRDGRELLRIRSKIRTYWKADNLDAFDGERWVTGDLGDSREAPSLLFEGVELRNQRKWTSEIRVNIRNLRTDTFVGAGVTDTPVMPKKYPIQTARAGIYRPATRRLQRGDVYTAKVYVPQPTPAELRRAGTSYTVYDLGRYMRIEVDPKRELGGDGTFLRRVAVSFLGFKADPELPDDLGEPLEPEAVLATTGVGRVWELARQLRAGADSPYEYVRAVERHLSSGYKYSETPPPVSSTLDGFLFDSKIGYCQQFSGAMALLLRMGGVPARVATGFSPGSLDRKAREFVVRDLDAHSWVEAWFQGIGWVTYDPTPTTAPPRSQADASTLPSSAIGDIGDLGTATLDPRRGGGARDGRPWGAIAAGAVLLLTVAAFVRRGLRRRRARRPAMLELERALRIAIGGIPPATTLAALESRVGAGSHAAGYLRALRAQRYESSGAGPTAAERRGLRRALAAGRGLRGRVRAWLALPPRLPRRGWRRYRF